jgi:hypothetical protein
VVECLPGMCKALGCIPCTEKEKKLGPINWLCTIDFVPLTIVYLSNLHSPLWATWICWLISPVSIWISSECQAWSGDSTFCKEVNATLWTASVLLVQKGGSWEFEPNPGSGSKNHSIKSRKSMSWIVATLLSQTCHMNFLGKIISCLWISTFLYKQWWGIREYYLIGKCNRLGVS